MAVGPGESGRQPEGGARGELPKAGEVMEQEEKDEER